MDKSYIVLCFGLKIHSKSGIEYLAKRIFHIECVHVRNKSRRVFGVGIKNTDCLDYYGTQF